MWLKEPVNKHFSNDTQMVKFAIETLKARQKDLDDMICSDTITCNRHDLESASDGKCQPLIAVCRASCDSFFQTGTQAQIAISKLVCRS